MPAPATSTTDKVACSTSKALREKEELSRVLRLAPRRASTGSVRVANHPGAVPKTTPVTNDNPNAKANTGGEGAVSIGRKCAL